jgi:nitrite reductase/ring-hydroxylating ferredoxin subunit
MANFQAVASVGEFPEGQGKVVKVGSLQILIINMEGDFYALDSFCGHRGAPLVQGEIVNGQLLCPWHGNTFDVSEGRCRANPEEKVNTFPVEVREGKIWVAVEEAGKSK